MDVSLRFRPIIVDIVLAENEFLWRKTGLPRSNDDTRLLTFVLSTQPANELKARIINSTTTSVINSAIESWD